MWEAEPRQLGEALHWWGQQRPEVGPPRAEMLTSAPRAGPTCQTLMPRQLWRQLGRWHLPAEFSLLSARWLGRARRTAFRHLHGSWQCQQMAQNREIHFGPKRQHICGSHVIG